MDVEKPVLPQRVLLTGVAGFIGGHLAERLLVDLVTRSASKPFRLIGIDDLNDYYHTSLKKNTLEIIMKTAIQQQQQQQPDNSNKEEDNNNNSNIRDERKKISRVFEFYAIDLKNFEDVEHIFKTQGPFDCIIHLAAQAGVRFSVERPIDSIQNNVVATAVLLECVAKYCPTAHLLLASSSSVYGADSSYPFNEEAAVCNRPLSIYAASKKSVEMLAQSYHFLYGIPITVLRFFTVYGPRGRPDMAVYKFIEAIINQQDLVVYGDGEAIREFTYIDDIIDGLTSSIYRGFRGRKNNEKEQLDNKENLSSLIEPVHSEVVQSVNHRACKESKNSTLSKYSDNREGPEIFNLGGGTTYTVLDLIKCIETVLGEKCKLTFQPMQLGDVPVTEACQKHIFAQLGFKPKVSLREGIRKTVEWYREWKAIQATQQPEKVN